MRTTATSALLVLGAIAIFGNGLKSIISSSVLVSEARFAAFLQIPIEHVALLLESIVAGMVVALAASPLLLKRLSARSLAMLACVAATMAFATFAIVAMLGLSPGARELAAFACFALGAAALALLAPTAQALVVLSPTAMARTTLTTLWTGAAPAGFLIAPQLIKVLLPVLGLGLYFLAFSVLPIVLLAMLALLAIVLPAVRGAGITPTTLPTRLLLALVATVVAFEVWTTLGSVWGYTIAAALLALVVFVTTGYWLVREARRFPMPPSLRGLSGMLLLALFVLEMPTTGFFDTAWLGQRHFAPSFIDDRSTLAAAAQILGTLIAGMLVHRRPSTEGVLLLAFGCMAVAGIAGIAAYPWVSHPLYLLWTPALQGFGAAGFTLLVCLGVVRDAARAPLLAALPSIAIMLGTEFGLEMLQLVYAVAQAFGRDENTAYASIFFVQVALATAAITLAAWALRRGAASTPD